MVHSAGFGAGECGEFGAGLSAAEELGGHELVQGVVDALGWESSSFLLQGCRIPRVHEVGQKSPPPGPLAHLQDGVGLQETCTELAGTQPCISGLGGGLLRPEMLGYVLVLAEAVVRGTPAWGFAFS